jgi:hypothetical protein
MIFEIGDEDEVVPEFWIFSRTPRGGGEGEITGLTGLGRGPIIWGVSE